MNVISITIVKRLLKSFRLISKSPQRALKSFLSVVISLQMVFGTQALANSTPAVQAVSVDPEVKQNVLAASTVSYADEDPIFKEFISTPAEGPMTLNYSPQDPAIDQDPFFLRTQAWVSKNGSRAASSKEFSFARQDNGIELAIPHSPSNLRLNLPITPFHVTDDFVFFSLNENSSLFKNAGGPDGPAEGIFFISRADLVSRGINNQAVPVHFFPLPGTGWTGKIDSRETPELNVLTILNKTGTLISLELSDVQTLMTQEDTNLMLSVALTVRNHGLNSQTSVYPAPGMTAFFGTYFTGIDLQSPSQSLWASTQTFEGRQSELDRAVSGLGSLAISSHSAWGSAISKLLRLNPFRSENAQALSLDPAVIHRLVFVGSVLGAMLVASIILKYAHPGIRMKLAKIHEGQPEPKGGLQIATRHASDIFRIFAHVTTTAGQMPTVNFANALELLFDRFAPTVASADNTVVRRFLKNTFYFTRSTSRQVPVDGKTLLLGGVVMGTVDTSSVVVQYMVAIPWMMHAVSPLLSKSMQERVAAAYSENNSNTTQLVENDSVRQGIAYALSGASSFSSDSRAQVMEAVVRDVETGMRAQGKDPLSAQYQAEKDKLVAAKIDVIMKQRGLPSKDNFLFDANTVFQALPRAMGYKTPDALAQDESFILATRFGLTTNALKKALKFAKAEAAFQSSSEAGEVVAILQETLDSMSFLKNGVTGGKAGLIGAREARQQLTLLSYEGPVEWAVKYVPDAWKTKFSPVSAQAASLLFRQALYSYLSAEGDALIRPLDKDQELYMYPAKNNAVLAVQQDHPELAKLSKAELEAKVKSDYAFELGIHTQLEIRRRAQAQAQALVDTKYTPPKGDWYARRQQARAERSANEKLAAYSASLGKDATPSQEQLDALWKSYYRDSIAKQVGLQLPGNSPGAVPMSDAGKKLLDTVDEIAEQSTVSEIKNDPGLAAWLAKATPAERLKVESLLYTNSYLLAYKTATTEQEMVPPVAPEQPGAFQRIRQTPWARSSDLITRSLRVAEAFTDDQALKLGWQAAASRNVPFFSDMWSTHRRLLKTLLPGITSSYLWSFYVWQVHLPYGTWVLMFLLSASTISVPSQWLNRVFRLNGIKIMGGILSKIAYAIPFSWVTFFGMIPLTLFAGDANSFYTDYVRDPFLSVFGQLKFADILALGAEIGIVAASRSQKFQTSVIEKVKNAWDALSGRKPPPNLFSPVRSAQVCKDIFGN